jgi:hypothetical protein
MALLSYPTFCADLLTSEEKEILSDIHAQYDSEDKVKLQNRHLTSLMILKERAAYLDALINKNEKTFSLSTNDLTNSLSKGNVKNIDVLYTSIKELSVELEKTRIEREEVNSQLSDTNLSMKALNNELNVLHSKMSHSIQELRKTVYFRIQKERSIPQSISGVVSVKCRTNISLESCINLPKTKQHVIEELSEQNGIENEDAKVVEFNVDDATMSMDGVTSIRASMKVQSPITNNIRKSIDKVLGLSSLNITLSSNVPSQFYIDGVYIGEGENISTGISIGSHSIYASYYGQYQSAIISTDSGSETFHFPFNESGKRKTDSNKDSATVGRVNQKETAENSVVAVKGSQKTQSEMKGKEENINKPLPIQKTDNGLPSSRETLKDDIRQLFIHKTDSMAIFIPTHSKKTDDTYYSDGNLLGRYTFNDASNICHSMGKKSLIATGEIYAELLNKGIVMNTVGMKSSFWISPEKVITKIDKDLYIKNVDATAKYSVLCMRFTGS